MQGLTDVSFLDHSSFRLNMQGCHEVLIHLQPCSIPVWRSKLVAWGMNSIYNKHFHLQLSGKSSVLSQKVLRVLSLESPDIQQSQL